jgi:hypothetical protein
MEQGFFCITYFEAVFYNSNYLASEEIKVLVYTVETETVFDVPAPRTRSNVGVGEKVQITLLPSLISVSQWAVSNAGVNDSVAGDGGNTGTFTAGEVGAHPSVRATFMDMFVDVAFTVVEPSNVYMVPIPGSQVNQPSPMALTFKTDVYILPSDVNFRKIQVDEDQLVPPPATVTAGYFTFKTARHSPNGPYSMTSFVAGYGTKVVNPDTLTATISGAGAPTWLAPGWWKWRIAWNYSLGGTHKRITTVEQLTTLKTNKPTLKANLSIDKAGAEGYFIDSYYEP